MYGHGRLPATEITRKFGMELSYLEKMFAVLQGVPVKGRFDMHEFNDDYDPDRLPRGVRFLGGGGFRYAKEFRGVLGKMVASDVERGYERTTPEGPVTVSCVIDDELLVPVWPLSLLDNAATRSFDTRPDALRYGHAFGIREYAGHAALLPLDQIRELHIDTRLARKVLQSE
jgi:hypothetical protein